MLARAGELPAEDAGWAYEIKWDGVRAIAYSAAGRAAPGEPQPQRHHRQLSRARPPRPGARLAPGGARRRDRRLRRRRAARASGCCSSACTSAPASRPGGWPSRPPSPTSIFDLLWLDGHSLMGLPYAERRGAPAGAGAERRELADARARRRARRRAAEGRRRAGPGGDRRQAPGLDLPARPASAAAG